MLLAKGANIFALTDTRETPYMLAKRKRAELGYADLVFRYCLSHMDVCVVRFLLL